jgi:hypothetical protein
MRTGYDLTVDASRFFTNNSLFSLCLVERLVLSSRQTITLDRINRGRHKHGVISVIERH